MRRVPFLLSILAGLATVFLSVVGFINMHTRPAIPGLDSRPLVSDKIDPRAVLTVDGNPVSTPNDIDFLLSRKKIGDPATYEIQTKAGSETVRTTLVPYYSVSPALFLAIGGFVFIIGFGVFALRSADPAARLYYWLSLAFGSAVVISGDLYSVGGSVLPLVPGVLFEFAYPFAPAILWRFARTFSPLRLKSRLRFVLVDVVAITIGGLFTYAFLYSQLRPSYPTFQTVQRWFPAFRWYVILVILAAVVELVGAYRASVSDEVRAQIKWIFFGLGVGLSAFLLLYQIPQALGGTEIISEDYSSLFFFVIPVSVAIAILKYRLMNINLVINRSLVYSLLTILVVGVYLASVEVLSRVFAGPASVRGSWISLGAAVLAAVAFNPGRKRIQLLVDRTFFRRSYDYGKAVMAFNLKAKKFLTPEHLLLMFREAEADVLPVERLGILVYEGDSDIPQITHFSGMDDLTARAIMALGAAGSTAPGGGEAAAAGPGPTTFAKETAVNTREGLDFAKQGLLDELRFDVLVPIPFGRPELSGAIALGPKKAGTRFSRDDIDLVGALAAELASGLQRMRLQEEVIYERASREKADELNRLKTEFITSVSHELRTPMSSLQTLSELLRSGRVRDAAKRERLLELMSGECGRLSRFLRNVLDFGKIERGMMTYSMQRTAVQPLIKQVVELATPAASADGISITADMPEMPIVITADPDALREALLNLVDNAIKYSRGRGDVAVGLLDRNGVVEIQVSDRGIGIEPGDREKIFDAFFRSARAAEVDPKGVGLGLKIVKHIMDAHGGRIGLQSEPGRGSIFSLIFPKGGNDEKDPDRR